MFKVGKLRFTLLVLVTSSVSLSINFFVNSLASSHAASSRGNRREHPRATTQVITTTASARDTSTTEALLHKQHTQSGNTQAQTSPQDKSAVHLLESNGNATSTMSSDSDTVQIHTENITSKPTLVKSVAINWCPEYPPLLEGLLAAMQQDITLQELMDFYPGFELGGRLRPTTCTPRERVAIIIPFRNRHAHLYILLNNIIPMLQRQQVDVTFFVIEQADPEIFNRGALFNVGFLEAEKIGDFDCFIFHDVDLIPINDRNMYRCSSNPRHFAVSMNKFRYRLLYKDYFGGVVGFTKKQYMTVNGCSNVYFGWGGEDDDLLLRVRNKNYTMVRYDTVTARYNMMSHQRDKGNEDNPMRAALLNNAKLRQDSEGLSSTQYQVNSISLERFYIWINVSLNMTQVLQNVPDSTLQVMKKEMEKTTLPPTPKKSKEKEEEKMLTCFLPANWNAKILLTLSLVTPDK